MIAYEDGTIFWVPPTQFSVLCDLDFSYWPFDEQKCYMKFGSWTHHGDQINLVEKDKPEVSTVTKVYATFQNRSLHYLFEQCRVCFVIFSV